MKDPTKVQQVEELAKKDELPFCFVKPSVQYATFLANKNEETATAVLSLYEYFDSVINAVVNTVYIRAVMRFIA